MGVLTAFNQKNGEPERACHNQENTYLRGMFLNWQNCPEVERAPDVVSGTLVFKGTRVPVAALFENLEDGAKVTDFLQWFPGVTKRQVDAVLEFAAKSLQIA